MPANIRTHYHLADYAGKDFPFAVVDVAEPSLPLHSHDFYEIFLVRSGGGTHLLERGTNALRPGDIALINPFARHGFIVDDGPLTITNIMFHGGLFAAVGALPTTPLAPFYAGAEHHGYTLRERAALTAVIDAMQKEFNGAEKSYRNAVSGLLLQLLALIERALAENACRDAGSMGAVLAHIDAHFTKDITLATIAGIAGLSTTYASEQFKRFTGKPFKQYLIGKRVQYAVHLLETTDEPVSRIAIKAGFNDIANFERTFKRYAGRPPLSFRGR